MRQTLLTMRNCHGYPNLSDHPCDQPAAITQARPSTSTESQFAKGSDDGQ